MKRVLLNVNDLCVSSEKGTRIQELSLYLREGETITLLGDRSSGSNTFFDFLCGKGMRISGMAKTINDTPIEDYLKKNLYAINEDIQHDDAEMKAFRDINIEDFLFLMDERGCNDLILNRKKIYGKAVEILSLMDIEQEPTTTIAKMNRLEILKLFIGKAILHDASIIAFKNDLEGFQSGDILNLANVLAKLKREKNISIVWCTNGLTGVVELSDRFCIFKNGTVVNMRRMTDEMTINALQMMLADLKERPQQIENKKAGTEVLHLLQVRGNEFFIELYEGEIISVVEYNIEKKVKLYEQLIGEEKGLNCYIRGSLVPPRKKFNGKKYPIIGINTFGRGGLFENMTIEDNLILPSLKKICFPNILMDSHLMEAVKREWKNKHPFSNNSIKDMSIYDRLSLQLESWLIYRPDVIVMLEPFLHLDQQGRGIFAQYFAQYKRIGISVIVLTGSESNYLGEDAEVNLEVFDRILKVRELEDNCHA